MSDFYTALADHYDDLFGCDEQTISFLSDEGAVAGARVLDVACGTGACTRLLLNRDVDAHGVDLSSPMVEIARRRADAIGIDPGRFTVGDMLEIDEHSAAPFRLVFCIGNSVSHLETLAEVERFVSATSRVLEGGNGRLVIQFVDVSAIPSGAEKVLPDLISPDAVMHRVYHRVSPSRIRFDASLVVHGEAEQHISQQLLVISTDEMMRVLARQGFARASAFGGFDRSPAARESWVRVVSGELS